MQALTRTEAEHLCIDRQIPLDENGRPDSRLPSESGMDFHIPRDAGARVSLAKALLEPFEKKKTLVWIDDWGVWPSGEHQPMFDRFRLSFGERRPLVEAPVHLFEAGETEDVISIVCFSILFLWDCYVLSLESKDNIFISHDEIGWIECEDKGDLQSLRERVTLR